LLSLSLKGTFDESIFQFRRRENYRGSVCVAIHGFFALGAFYLGRFISSIIFPELQCGKTVALAFAVMTFLGSMWIFQFGEYAYEDLEHYWMKTGKDFRLAYGYPVAYSP